MLSINFRKHVWMLTAAVTAGIILLSASVFSAQADSAVVTKCKADLAKKLNIKASEIETTSTKAVKWPDSSLGMPVIGKMYAQAVTPGSVVILKARNINYVYTTGKNQIKYGGQVDMWAFSMLYMKPIKNDANLNNDLYQCSVLGTNAKKVASEVSDFYPQYNGKVIFKRRMSRSSFDLLYVDTKDPKKEIRLCRAMDFGDAAFNEKQDQWAAFVRPRLGTSWHITIGKTEQDSKELQNVELPEDMTVGLVAWSEGRLMILNVKDQRRKCYELCDTENGQEWRSISAYGFPKLPEYVLNKSQSLEIVQMEKAEKPTVEVALVWFTGDRDVSAKLENFKMTGQDFIAGRYAAIWGEKDSKPAFALVDIYRGDVVYAAGGIGRDVKPFYCSPSAALITHIKAMK